MLKLLLDKRSRSFGLFFEPNGRRTEDEARAFAPAFIASFESSFASFHALILTGRCGTFLPLSGCWTASGSIVDGSRPGSR